MRLNALPFHIGATDKAVNPAGLPNVYPFELGFDSHRGVLAQRTCANLEKVLREAYALGQAFGTPLADDKHGRPYVEDFLSFIQTVRPKLGRGLEIGAGVGYLTRRLLDAGWDMTSLEPGQGYEAFWAVYGVRVIREFFPSSQAPGPYQLVCSYGVLEHVPDPLSFLKAIKEHLAPSGRVVISVPDCTDEIRDGDPSILFHEHFNYFDAGSLRSLIELAGMNVKVVKSSFGRCLYAVAGMEPLHDIKGELGLNRDLVASYPERCQSYIQRLRETLSDMASKETLGVYCAARALPLLDPLLQLRFFDDDPAQQGKFLPPFQCPIESGAALFVKPVEHLVIMSRTFGQRIHDSLCKRGYKGKIVTLEEM